MDTAAPTPIHMRNTSGIRHHSFDHNADSACATPLVENPAPSAWDGLRAALREHSLPAIVQPRSIVPRDVSVVVIAACALSRRALQLYSPSAPSLCAENNTCPRCSTVMDMQNHDETQILEELALPALLATAATDSPRRYTSRNTPRDTWAWLWKDTLFRVTPFAIAGGWYLRHSRRTEQRNGRHVAEDLALGVTLGIPMAALASAFRGYVAPGYRLPTAGDQALQTAFYFGVNAPAEEMFWRGMVQSATVNGLRRLPAVRRAAPVLGWAATTTVFGAYHRLGKWSWRSIAGVTAAGGLFGALYQFRPTSRGLLAPIIVHGFATAGFLSWGDALLHLRERRRSRVTSR